MFPPVTMDYDIWNMRRALASLMEHRNSEIPEIQAILDEIDAFLTEKLEVLQQLDEQRNAEEYRQAVLDSINLYGGDESYLWLGSVPLILQRNDGKIEIAQYGETIIEQYEAENLIKMFGRRIIGVRNGKEITDPTLLTEAEKIAAEWEAHQIRRVENYLWQFRDFPRPVTWQPEVFRMHPDGKIEWIGLCSLLGGEPAMCHITYNDEEFEWPTYVWVNEEAPNEERIHDDSFEIPF